MGSSDGRGDVSGGDYGDRQRGTRSAVAGESEGDERGVREDERGRGGRVAPLDVSRRQRKQEVASPWPARGEHAPLPPGARRTMTGEASRLGRARWAGQLR